MKRCAGPRTSRFALNRTLRVALRAHPFQLGNCVRIDSHRVFRQYPGMQTFEPFDGEFPSDEACKAYIVGKRWPDGVRCPRCQSVDRIYALKKPFHWTCCNKDCGGRKGYRFSVTTGTIFQDTKISLRLWFEIGYLMLTAKKGVSSLQVRRVIFGEDSGSDWRTTWYICHRWRAAMNGDAFPLTGEVEVDETFVGGKAANKHKSKRTGHVGTAGKVAVIGAIAL